MGAACGRPILRNKIMPLLLLPCGRDAILRDLSVGLSSPPSVDAEEYGSVAWRSIRVTSTKHKHRLVFSHGVRCTYIFSAANTIKSPFPRLLHLPGGGGTRQMPTFPVHFARHPIFSPYVLTYIRKILMFVIRPRCCHTVQHALSRQRRQVRREKEQGATDILAV